MIEQTKTGKMVAYHGDPKIKTKYLARVRAHRKADQLLQNYGYWKDGKGCAVGCTIHDSSHAAYEVELGIPRVLARLEDYFFEKMPVDDARVWPEKFLKAITPGRDLSSVIDRFMLWLLIDPTDGMVNFTKREKSIAAIQQVAELYRRKLAGEGISDKEWRDAAAYAAAYADAYTYAAAYAAAYAYTYAAAYAAAAADAAADAAAAAYAVAYECQKPHVKMADKLIELLKAA